MRFFFTVVADRDTQGQPARQSDKFSLGLEKQQKTKTALYVDIAQPSVRKCFYRGLSHIGPVLGAGKAA